MRDILFLAAGVLILMELTKRRQTGGAPPPPIPDQEKALLAYGTPRVGGYFPSYLPGARPQSPFQVRWGDGDNFLDTTKKARLAI